MKQSPTFSVYCGPMFSAKTSRILYDAERLKYQQKPFLAFKPLVDIRYGEQEIVSHLGAKLRAIQIESGDSLMQFLASTSEPYEHILVDEVFMIPGIAVALIWLFRQGISIHVSTLDLSYACKPFTEVQAVLPWATKIEKCTAVCTACGADAHFTYRKNQDDIEIVIGGADMYEPRCFNCHPSVRK